MDKQIKLFDNTAIESFGGSSLPENMAKAELAIAELENDFRLFNHSNSQFTWNFFILNHKGGLRNVRQISAEINKKRNALIEAKYKHLEKLAMADLWREQLADEQSPARKKLLEIKIEKTEKMAALALAPIEGALKDIITLHGHYKSILESHKNHTEKDFEEAEVAYWVRRCFSQCLRDLRQFNTVTKGEQEPLENMGLNVLHVVAELRNYLNEGESKTDDGACLDEFLDQCVVKYAPGIKERFKLVGASCSEITKG